MELLHTKLAAKDSTAAIAAFGEAVAAHKRKRAAVDAEMHVTLAGGVAWASAVSSRDYAMEAAERIVVSADPAESPRTALEQMAVDVRKATEGVTAAVAAERESHAAMVAAAIAAIDSVLD